MSVAIVTGSSGLIGSETSRFLHEQGLDVIGIDNNMRRYFFGEDSSVQWNTDRLKRELPRFTPLDIDVRNQEALSQVVEQNVDCVFGSRFTSQSRIIDYPPLKLLLNRLANFFIQVIFRLKYNDVTNAFKLYRRPVIQGLQPLLSHHFNLTVELPLKAIIRGFSYRVLPNDWTNRKAGVSKLKIEEMGSRYLFIVLYCWLEKTFSRGDYVRRPKHSLPRLVPDQTSP